MRCRGRALLWMYNDVNNQQDATTFYFIDLFNSALHVSGDKFAHRQEHFLTVYTAFGTMHRHCCRPVPRLRWKSVPSQPWHRSSSISIVAPVNFHLNRGISRQQCRCIVPKAVYTVKKCSWGWANLWPETCRAELKRLINEKVVAYCWLLTSLY